MNRYLASSRSLQQGRSIASRLTITVGTRGSRLAMRQTPLVVDSLRAQDPQAQIEIKEIKTQGARDQRASLTKISGQGVFVKEQWPCLLIHIAPGETPQWRTMRVR